MHFVAMLLMDKIALVIESIQDMSSLQYDVDSFEEQLFKANPVCMFVMPTCLFRDLESPKTINLGDISSQRGFHNVSKGQKSSVGFKVF